MPVTTKTKNDLIGSLKEDPHYLEFLNQINLTIDANKDSLLSGKTAKFKLDTIKRIFVDYYGTYQMDNFVQYWGPIFNTKNEHDAVKDKVNELEVEYEKSLMPGAKLKLTHIKCINCEDQDEFKYEIILLPLMIDIAATYAQMGYKMSISLSVSHDQSCYYYTHEKFLFIPYRKKHEYRLYDFVTTLNISLIGLILNYGASSISGRFFIQKNPPVNRQVGISVCCN